VEDSIEQQPRNCSFQSAAHRALLSPDSVKVSIPPSTTDAPGVGILPYLLLPLAGPEEYDLEVRAAVACRDAPQLTRPS
jgi:hypothetical protein